MKKRSKQMSDSDDDGFSMKDDLKKKTFKRFSKIADLDKYNRCKTKRAEKDARGDGINVLGETSHKIRRITNSEDEDDDFDVQHEVEEFNDKLAQKRKAHHIKKRPKQMAVSDDDGFSIKMKDDLNKKTLKRSSKIADLDKYNLCNPKRAEKDAEGDGINVLGEASHKVKRIVNSEEDDTYKVEIGKDFN